MSKCSADAFWRFNPAVHSEPAESRWRVAGRIFVRIIDIIITATVAIFAPFLIVFSLAHFIKGDADWLDWINVGCLWPYVSYSLFRRWIQ